MPRRTPQDVSQYVGASDQHGISVLLRQGLNADSTNLAAAYCCHFCIATRDFRRNFGAAVASAEARACRLRFKC